MIDEDRMIQLCTNDVTDVNTLTTSSHCMTYYEANKDQVLARSKAYYEANKTQIAARSKAYYEANKTQIAARSKAYYEANKEQVKARVKTYREENKEQLAISDKAYREANKEQQAARGKIYYEKNKEQVKARSKAYYEANNEHVATTTKARYEANRPPTRACMGSEEHRRRQSAVQQGIPYDNWEGYARNSLYCPEYTEKCRESNREKYDRRCFLSGMTEEENGQKLSVHHVDMNKQQGCDGHRWKLVPLSRVWHARTHNETWTARIKYLLENVWI